MPDRHLPARLVAVAFIAALLAACTTAPPPRTSPTTPRERVVTGEVSWVSPADRQIEVRDRGARTIARYDDSTRVVFAGQDYRPADLEVGDRVRIEAVSRGYEDLYATHIEVLESVSHAPGTGTGGGTTGIPPRDESPDVLAGEVSAVYTSQEEIRLRTASGDRVVAYDGRTRVLYRGQEYAPQNLEAGDVVRIEVDRPGARRPYAEIIEVTQSVQDRPGYRPDDPTHGGVVGARAELSGTVEWIDDRGGELAVRTNIGDLVTVEIPFNATREVRDWFDRVRRGDRVRLEIEWLERDSARRRVELIRILS